MTEEDDAPETTRKLRALADRRNPDKRRIADLEGWKESAMMVLDEWHRARELIGGAQLGDGPVEWAKRIRERLRNAEDYAIVIGHANAEWSKQALGWRASALEEAAKVAEEVGQRWLGRGEAAFQEVATAIRHLKEQA